MPDSKSNSSVAQRISAIAQACKSENRATWAEMVAAVIVKYICKKHPESGRDEIFGLIDQIIEYLKNIKNLVRLKKV